MSYTHQSSLTRTASASGRSSLLLIFFLLALTIGGGVLWISRLGNTPLSPGSQTQQILEVAKGTAPNEIARKLEALKVIPSAQSFILLGKVLRKWRKIKTGEYQVSPAMTSLQIFDVLTSGISIIHPVTIKEGNNLYEVASAIEGAGLGSSADFVSLAKSPEFTRQLLSNIPQATSLEGFLFPDTYHFTKVMTKEDLLRQMVRRHTEVWTDEMEKKAAELGMTRFEVITLASMIEKETGAGFERPLISSVFHNRLKKKMRLQSDPTTIYGIWHRYTGNIRKSDLLEPSDYNTYTVPALPVGPISNPGKDSIIAALNPEKSPYFYFVSKNNGTHLFSATYAEHNQGVRDYQLNSKAREGKSWRDLRNKGDASAKRSAL